MDSNRDDGDEERMLDADFANDDLVSFGYHRSGSGLLVPLGHVRDEQPDVATHDALVPRRGSRDELILPQPGSLHEPAAAPQHPARRQESERPPLKQTNNFSVSVSIDHGASRARSDSKQPASHHEEAVDRRGPGKEGEQSRDQRSQPNIRSSRRPACNLCTISILILAVLTAISSTMWISMAGVEKDIAFEPTGPRQPTPPSAIADSLTKLDYDTRQLERLHGRATAHLPVRAGLRQVLRGSTQPHLLRHEVARLQGLRARLLGGEYESNITHHIRISEARLRTLLEQVGWPNSMGNWLRAVTPRWMRLRLAGMDPRVSEAVQAEQARAAAMVEEVREIVASISGSRDAALRACQSRPRQDAQGGWVLGDSSVCRRDEEGSEVLGHMGRGPSEVDSDAKTALGFINWICQDLDAITVTADSRGAVHHGPRAVDSGAHDAQAHSLAAEAVRVLTKWQDLASQWQRLGEL